jgi:hypothetical protein
MVRVMVRVRVRVRGMVAVRVRYRCIRGFGDRNAAMVPLPLNDARIDTGPTGLRVGLGLRVIVKVRIRGRVGLGWPQNS